MPHVQPDPRVEAARANAWQSALPAVLMLYYGFFQETSGISNSELYNRSVTVFFVTLKLGGCALAVVAGLSALGLPLALAADGVLSIVCGALFVACGVIWALNSDMQGLLLLLFGAMFLSSGRAAWTTYQQFSAVEPVEWADVNEPEHPASKPSEALPRTDEPPPADGYLAALSREKSRPSRAEHD